ncbi:PadR family transcriptional regulator [Streptomyces sp. NTH33]|uniref:PadR family transcriptional regulator n=1 Tax=Streptomyces sp. NTH33 TaxID=1735453 RepID=UPI000DA86CDF|nr:PadR family transcriptional regulator [Streptomyces sp. NTH33]PZG92120.1 PadR family transcriptional regulator [Streptomyces sp. NTH33]
MAIRHGLLALLADGPRHGSRLRIEFAACTGSSRPPGAGRVRAALGRLERDGLVTPEDVDGAGRVLYALTDAGRAEVRAWYARPVERAGPSRDELVIKLVLAAGAPGVDVRQVVETQRRHVSEALHDHVRRRAEALSHPPGSPAEVARLLVLEQLVWHAEAEVRWLDHCEARLLRLGLARDTGAEK